MNCLAFSVCGAFSAFFAVGWLHAQQLPPKATEGLHYQQAPVIELSKRTITVQVPGAAAKQFVLSETLAAGKTPSVPRPRAIAPYFVAPPDKYRVSDVKVGDEVTLIYAVVNGIEVCDHLRIIKRPGGLVPPLPEDAGERDPLRYHERMNAHWDLEDNGIPYPEKFGPGRRFPIAPPPREVKR